MTARRMGRPVVDVLSGLPLFATAPLYRRWHTRWGATDAEVSRPMPGDETVPKASFNATRAITIEAPPEQVWPWIVQLGYRRAGFYTYDLLDNAGYESADRILPEYQDGGFLTPSGKCELYSERLARTGADPLPAYVPPAESPRGNPSLAARFPLILLTAKGGHHFLNSSYANVDRALKAEKTPMLEIHPDDAEPRGIGDSELVRVFNDRGSVHMPARIGDRIRPGVVSMPSGWWASLSPGGSSANALTPDGLSDLGGGGDFHDTLVQVEPVR